MEFALSLLITESVCLAVTSLQFRFFESWSYRFAIVLVLAVSS
jgi:hypothetical protein